MGFKHPKELRVCMVLLCLYKQFPMDPIVLFFSKNTYKIWEKIR